MVCIVIHSSFVPVIRRVCSAATRGGETCAPLYPIELPVAGAGVEPATFTFCSSTGIRRVSQKSGGRASAQRRDNGHICSTG
ncbi:conserved protein of unknown function [Ectopseudomonas oleovorans]|uniref:Uncharacterized protein n=1 Tax=Ectopseudomonas oleovorans TaxID=301 RepID=A0A653B7Z1_ECTOL|nr:conserved protein of unknown function [Pseudomonas oleovorans]